MRIGLCGAQRVGKTTLAREFSKASGLQFVPTNTRQIMKELGADPTIHYPPRERLQIQEVILTELCRQWDANNNCIFDRTPLDVLAYMEADILRDFQDDSEIIDAYMSYRTRCLKSVAQFNRLILIQPGIAVVNEEGAALGSLPYMEHFNTLCLGYMHHVQITYGVVPSASDVQMFVMRRDMLSLSQRVKFIELSLGTI